MLDFFCVQLPAGFPDHPHRGFETVTYMLEGEIHHEDFSGNAGKIGPGDIQWMTAGKGIVHAEMPYSFEKPSKGFQLWINLDAKNKFCQPQYQEHLRDKIPTYSDPQLGMVAKVVSGQVFGVKGPIEARTPTYFIDFQFSKNSTCYEHEIPAGWNALILCYQGSVKVQKSKIIQSVEVCHFKRTTKAETFHIETLSENTRVLLLAGLPIDEPIANYGPFVLNT